MTPRRRWTWLLAALQMLAVAASAQVPPIRIMPLGDSITYGYPVAGGYRNKLHQSLTAAGYNVDFVGTQSENGVATLPDSDHEGHNGWTIAQIDANIAGFFNSIASPDVILLHIGTNDFTSGTDTPTAIDRLDALITKMATLRPYAHIIVTNLLARDEPYNSVIQAQFNPFVEARANAQAALGRRVTFLDMRSVVPLAEMPEQLHPNQAGYDHMADAWLTAIESVITPLGDNLPPGIASTVATDSTHVVVTFSKPVEDAAATIEDFSINGLTISAATLDATTKRDVTLTTSAMAVSASYTVTVSGVRDRTVAANLIAPGSSVNFTSPDLAAPAIVMQDGTVLLRYLGSPNNLFIVQRSSDLAQWTNIAAISANAAGAVAFTDPGPPAGSAFYRLARITP